MDLKRQVQQNRQYRYMGEQTPIIRTNKEVITRWQKQITIKYSV